MPWEVSWRSKGKVIYSQVPVLPQPFLSDFGQVNSLNTMSFPKSHEDNINLHALKLLGKLAHEYL